MLVVDFLFVCLFQDYSLKEVLRQTQEGLRWGGKVGQTERGRETRTDTGTDSQTVNKKSEMQTGRRTLR